MSHLPQPIRKNDVLEKLSYAEVQCDELVNALFDSYETDELPKFVSMKAEGILSNARECFDYLAHDLIEGYLVPVASPQFVANYRSGKGKFYFPFYAGQLKQNQWPWCQFKTVDKGVFDHLRGFIDAMDQRQLLANTSLAAQDFRVVQELVNEKKHSKVSQFDAIIDAAVFYQGPVGSILLNKATASIAGLEVGAEFGGGNPKSVPEFRFAANGRQVDRLCRFAVTATKIVMDWWYETYFQSHGQRINTSGPMLMHGVPIERPMWAYENP